MFPYILDIVIMLVRHWEVPDLCWWKSSPAGLIDYSAIQHIHVNLDALGGLTSL